MRVRTREDSLEAALLGSKCLLQQRNDGCAHVITFPLLLRRADGCMRWVLQRAHLCPIEEPRAISFWRFAVRV